MQTKLLTQGRMRSVAICAALLMLTTSVVYPKRSEAFVGGVVTLSGAVPVGLGMLKVGGIMVASGSSFGLTGYLALKKAYSPENAIKKVFTFVVPAVVLLGLGILVLDESASSDVLNFNFDTLSPEAARELGVSESNRTTYNDELPLIQAVGESIVAELTQMENPTMEKAGELWNLYRSELSPETFTIMGRIVEKSIQLSN